MWQARTLGEIMYACIIMHNMIVEDEREAYQGRHDYNYEQGSSPVYGQGPIRLRRGREGATGAKRRRPG